MSHARFARLASMSRALKSNWIRESSRGRCFARGEHRQILSEQRRQDESPANRGRHCAPNAGQMYIRTLLTCPFAYHRDSLSRASSQSSKHRVKPASPLPLPFRISARARARALGLRVRRARSVVQSHRGENSRGNSPRHSPIYTFH